MEWTVEEDNLLKECYDSSKEELLSLFKNRTLAAITQRANKKLNIFKDRPNYRYWSKQEDDLLRQSYNLTKKELLKLFYPRSYDSIKLQANKLGLYKLRNEYCNSNCDKLLEESLEAYYWLGFILADGHISKNCRLSLTLAILDEIHLQKFADFIQAENPIDKRNGNVNVKVQDKYALKLYKEKFDICNNKTETPPKLDFYKQIKADLFLAMFCGYVDGDGCIKYQTGRKDCCLGFHIHANWLPWLTFFQEKLLDIFKIELKSVPIIGKDGYAKWTISNNKLLAAIKKFAQEKELPVLRRKWDKIDENYLSVEDRTLLKYPKFCELYSCHKKWQLVKLLKISYETYAKFESLRKVG